MIDTRYGEVPKELLWRWACSHATAMHSWRCLAGQRDLLPWCKAKELLPVSYSINLYLMINKVFVPFLISHKLQKIGLSEHPQWPILASIAKDTPCPRLIPLDFSTEQIYPSWLKWISRIQKLVVLGIYSQKGFFVLRVFWNKNILRTYLVECF